MRQPRIVLWPVIALTLSGALGVAVAAGLATVTQQRRAFSVRSLDIARGDTVRFNNEDSFTHQIYVDSPKLSFESDEQPPGEAVNVTFAADGTFEVRCHIHPKMLLSVNVRR